jgi:hypothetical protein
VIEEWLAFLKQQKFGAAVHGLISGVVPGAGEHTSRTDQGTREDLIESE